MGWRTLRCPHVTLLTTVNIPQQLKICKYVYNEVLAHIDPAKCLFWGFSNFDGMSV